ncbi:MAG TPA: hypothetical protein VHR55_07680 [Candidatus Limnocylindria bacterium]|nr:hypothetical protein [Candidatus Limnocylindria bacterium]
MRPSARNSIILAIVGLAALAALGAVIVPRLGPAPLGGAATTGATSSVPAAASDAAEPNPEPADLGAFTWVLTDIVQEDVTRPPDAYQIRAGDAESAIPTLDVVVPFVQNDALSMTDRRPPVAAPVGGRIVYASDDGARSVVHSVAIADPTDDRVIADLGEVVWSVVVDPDGSAAYLQLVDRRADPPREVGVVAVGLDGSGVTRLLPPAAAAAIGPIRRVAILSFQGTLAIAGDGSLLARAVCTGPDDCVTDILDLRAGDTWRLEAVNLVGMVAGTLIVVDSCEPAAPFPCELAAIDLRTDERRVLANDVQGAVTRSVTTRSSSSTARACGATRRTRPSFGAWTRSMAVTFTSSTRRRAARSTSGSAASSPRRTAGPSSTARAAPSA